MDITALVNEVVEKSKPVEPICKVCVSKMMRIGWGNGTEEWACSRVKPTNMVGDHRPFDPGHYDQSRVKLPMGVDLAKLRTHLAEAFGKVEAEIEKRVREEYASAHKAAQTEKPAEKPVEEPVAAATPSAPGASAEGEAKKKSKK